MWILEDFQRSPVQDAFRLQAHEEWPDAVQWLLSSYALETALDAALRKLQATSQGTAELVRDFGLRVKMEANYIGALVLLPELKALFCQGLRDPV